MSQILKKYRDDMKESLTNLYNERDRLREEHKFAKMSLREDLLTGKISRNEYDKIMRTMRKNIKVSMDAIFDKIRERKRILERLENYIDDGREDVDQTD